MGTDGTRPVEKRRNGVSESAGGCRKQSSKCCLLIGIPTTAPRVSRLPDELGCGAEKPVSPAEAEILSTASRLPEDQLRTAVQLICTAGLEFRWGEHEKKKRKK